MSTYVLVVFIHIAAAVVLLGTSILGEPAVRAAARRASQPQELRAFLQIGQPIVVIAPAAAMVILASGIYLSSVGGFWRLGWVQVALTFWLVNAFLAGVVVRPAVKRVWEEATGSTDASIGGRLDDLRWSGVWTLGVDVMAANDAAMLYLMTMKPGLAGSLAVVVLANALVAGVRLLMGARRPAAAPASAMPDA